MPVAACVLVDIVPGTPAHGVVTNSTRQFVIAGTAYQLVIAGTAIQTVVAFMAVNSLLTASSRNRVITGRADVMDASNPGGLGGTYAGNPVACAAAHAVLDAIEEENLCERANAIGKLILDRCNALKERSNLNCIGDVRGLGAMCAIELVKDVASGDPAPQLTQTLMKVANDNGLILLSCGTYANVIRFLVPLTASDQIVRDGMDIFETSLTEAVTRVA